MTSRGFSLVELLVALVVCALLSAAIAGLVPPARAAFDAVPAALDLQQRGRTGVDVLVTSIRSASLGASSAVILLSPAEDDSGETEFEALYVVTPVANASQGMLDRDQPGAHGALRLAAGPGCPAVPDVCGFAPGAVAAITDASGRFDVFIVASTHSSRRELVPVHALSSAYAAGSGVVEVDAHLFRLDAQDDGSRALVRETAGGATQPIVDNVAGMGIQAWGGHPLIRLGRTTFEDGPWLAGGPEGIYDADFRAVRRLDLWIRVEAASPALRAHVPDRTLHASTSVRNAQ